MTFVVVTVAALAAGPSFASDASAATAVATPGLHSAGRYSSVARYSFDAGAPGGSVADDSGRGGTLRVVSRAGGALRVIAGETSQAVLFPARCGADCPRAILEGRDDDALDPGRRPIRYGADLLLRAEQTSRGSNVVQKGAWSSDSQWKLQVDGRAGRPSCVLVGTGSRRAYLAVAPDSIADGRWHQVTCERSGTVLKIVVDAVQRAQVSLPAGLTVSNSAPLRIGGNGVAEHSDRFYGALDNVFVSVG
jgi:hypothetical protein